MNKILMIIVCLIISLTTRADERGDQINSIEKTVYRWNEIHNTKSVNSFSADNANNIKAGTGTADDAFELSD